MRYQRCSRRLAERSDLTCLSCARCVLNSVSVSKYDTCKTRVYPSRRWHLLDAFRDLLTSWSILIWFGLFVLLCDLIGHAYERRWWVFWWNCRSSIPMPVQTDSDSGSRLGSRMSRSRPGTLLRPLSSTSIQRKLTLPMQHLENLLQRRTASTTLQQWKSSRKYVVLQCFAMQFFVAGISNSVQISSVLEARADSYNVYTQQPSDAGTSNNIDHISMCRLLNVQCAMKSFFYISLHSRRQQMLSNSSQPFTKKSS